jgi:GntR family transcriptional repressor for pyruvate dehydrogenase complex
MLDHLKPIIHENTVEIIIGQIRFLISSGVLKPGDRLPAERKLAEHLGVSRSQIREAIRKLEFYGILKTLPQSGTSVSGLGIVALEGLISDVLKLEKSDFYSLIETRILLETEAAYKAAVRRSDEDIVNIEKSLKAYEAKRMTNDVAIDEDFMFHMKIAEASKNSVLTSLMLIITPDLLQHYQQLEVCDPKKNNQRMQEHRAILEAIKEQDPDKAMNVMRHHLNDIQERSLLDRHSLDIQKNLV